MNYTVYISDEAAEDLQKIYRYIRYELLSPIAAEQVLDELQSEISDLDTMPRRYRRYASEPWKSRGLRQMPVGNFVVFYIPDEEHLSVNIIRVMYGGRDIEKELQKI